nr:MAG TPA: hypothetical protein [Caudoviricetes sp.]
MIEIYVSGNEIKQSGQNCGVCGEGNSTEMHLIFGSDWDSYSKRVVFYDAHGQTPTAVLISGSSAVQTISIPFEPLKYEGDIEYVIEGSKENAKKKSVAGRLRVRYAPMTDGAGAPEDVTPTQAEQLQILIAAAESAAKEYADTKAETAEGNAKAYADSKAQAAETAAKEYADGKAGAALTSAKEYADTKASAAEGNAKEYADSIKPTKVSQLENDSGYLTEHQSLAGYATEEYADNAAEGAETSVKEYADTELAKKANKQDDSGGGVIGGYAQTHDGGGAVGLNAESTYGGGAVGRNAKANEGSAAVGDGANANYGAAAVGCGSIAINGGAAIGYSAEAGSGFSGGKNAKVSKGSNGQYKDAIQLGTGTNENEKTLQVYDYQLMDKNGKIPEERLKPITADKIADGVIPTKVSELENDSGYLNEHQSLAGYATAKYADNAAAGAKSAAKSYTDTKSAAALNAAKSYADTKLEKKVDKEDDYTLSKVRDLELSYGDDCVLLEVTKTSSAGTVGPTNPSSVVWEVKSCDFYNTEQANNKNAETLAAAKDYTDTKLAGKADRYAISASVTGNTLLLADKSDTQLLSAAAAALTLTLPETVTSGYECFFSFRSGATATSITAPSGITWTGADCNSSREFIPLANTVYEVGIRCIGFSSDGAPYLSARVGAC